MSNQLARPKGKGWWKTWSGLAVLAIAAVVYFLGSDSAASSVVISPSDLEVNGVYEYSDFYSCSLPDGSRAYDFHFMGPDRSRRNQLISRLNNVGERTMTVVTNDPSLSSGHIRLVLRSVAWRDVEGHNFGTDWSAEYLQINPRRTIETATRIPPCGPARR